MITSKRSSSNVHIVQKSFQFGECVVHICGNVIILIWDCFLVLNASLNQPVLVSCYGYIENTLTFYFLGRLKVHLAIHDEVHPFVCHECGKGFKQLSQLKNHQVIHKNPETDEVCDL